MHKFQHEILLVAFSIDKASVLNENNVLKLKLEILISAVFTKQKLNLLYLTQPLNIALSTICKSKTQTEKNKYKQVEHFDVILS